MPKLFPKYAEKIRAYSHIAITQLSGGHHLHMEQEVTQVAAVLNPFFSKRD
jgi:hypothetical protein